MTQEEIVKIVCDYFKSLEDAKVADYERDLNDPSWSNTDAYCYTPEASTKYATVEDNKGDVTIHYNEFTVFVRNMPSVNIHHVKITYDGKEERYGHREEVGNKLAQVTTMYHGECSADFLKLSSSDIIPLIQSCEKNKNVVEVHIIEENWRKNCN